MFCAASARLAGLTVVSVTGRAASQRYIHWWKRPFFPTCALYIHSPNGSGVRVVELPNRALFGGEASASSTLPNTSSAPRRCLLAGSVTTMRSMPV